MIAGERAKNFTIPGLPMITRETWSEIEASTRARFDEQQRSQISVQLWAYAVRSQGIRLGIKRSAVAARLKKLAMACTTLQSELHSIFAQDSKALDEAVAVALFPKFRDTDYKCFREDLDQLLNTIKTALGGLDEIEFSKRGIDGPLIENTYAVYIAAGGAPHFSSADGTKAGSAAFIELLRALLELVPQRGTLIGGDDVLRKAVERTLSG